ncbi:MAG TPA: glycosyltransferase family 4 protein [Actinomycetota bacterium]|nr:glycosyltransferase family 4 protein [Actinomycetota bacterium]
MTRILFFGDLASTGFGTVTMDLGRAMLELGHDLRFVSQNDLGDLPEPFLSRTFSVNPKDVDPTSVAAFGTNSLSLTVTGLVGLFDGRLWPDGWKPEACLLLGDFMNTRRMVMKSDETKAAFMTVPTFHYVPIEGVDLPPSWAGFWEVVHPVAMSKFGAEQIAAVTGTAPPVVYHGVDTHDFRPLTERHLKLNGKNIRDRAGAKKWFGGSPNAKWVLRTDRHMPRKRYASLLRAMFPVLAPRRDVFLVIHCLTDDQGGNLRDTLSKYPEWYQKRVILTGLVDVWGPVPRDLLIALYNAADVYVSVSAEGFGLTIAEAMACGVPAVGMAYSAVPEVIGPGGLVAPVNHLIDNEYDHAWAAVDEKVFGEQVAKLLDDDLLRARLGKAAREHVRSSFSWTTAALQFGAIIREKV